jgi:hypothetical protein
MVESPEKKKEPIQSAFESAYQIESPTIPIDEHEEKLP